jgi:alkylhydroperoxidase/carboxymuconolactone decarboxylase family protein YurZ
MPLTTLFPLVGGKYPKGGSAMKMRKKILDFEYEEVLDAKVRELIRIGCAVAVGCPT